MTSIENIDQSRRDAKRLARANKLPLHEAQDQVAKSKGFRNWSIYAKRAAALPNSPSRQSLIRASRYYLHGDQDDQNPLHYYCKECDVFLDAAHFSLPHRVDHAERTLEAINFFYRQTDDVVRKTSRPVGAPNLFTAQVAALTAAIKAREATQSPFYRWLCKQENRGDAVGDLGYDVKRDKRFPVEASIRKAKSYLRNDRWVSDEVLAALQAAWIEFSAPKHRRRVM